MHDDLYDFFLQELPGYDMVGYRDTNLVCWGCFDDPDYVDYDYRNMTEWGAQAVHHAGHRYQRRARSPPTSSRSTWRSGSCSAARTSTTGRTSRRSSPQDPLGNPVDKHHPWNKVTLPKPQKRDFADKYIVGRLAAHLRQAHRHLRRAATPAAARSRASGCTAKAGPRRPRLPQGHRRQHPDGAAALGEHARDGARVEGARRSRTRSSATARAPTTRRTRRSSALHCLEQALREVRAGRTKSWSDFKVPEDAVSVGFHEAARGVLSHHMVIRDGQDRELPAVPADAVERQPARRLRHARARTRTRCRTRRSSRRTARRTSRAIDIMRAVRSFDPCLPCGVHMYTGGGQGAEGDAHADGAAADGRRPPTRTPTLLGARPGADASARRDRGRRRARARRGARRRRDRRCTATGCGGSSATRPPGGGQEIRDGSRRTAWWRACC